MNDASAVHDPLLDQQSSHPVALAALEASRSRTSNNQQSTGTYSIRPGVRRKSLNARPRLLADPPATCRSISHQDSASRFLKLKSNARRATIFGVSDSISRLRRVSIRDEFKRLALRKPGLVRIEEVSLCGSRPRRPTADCRNQRCQTRVTCPCST